MNKIPAWQWPVDDVSDVESALFSRSWDGKPAQWEALAFPRLGETITYVWLRPDWRDGLFCICDAAGNSAQIRQFQAVEEWQLRTMGADALNKARIGRLYFLGPLGRLREQGEVATTSVIIRADGHGVWERWSEDNDVGSDWRQDRTPFCLFHDAGMNDFLRRPALDVWRLLERALSEPNSDASFARGWMSQTEEQREDLVWNWPRTEREARRAEFEDRLLWALLAQTELWQKNQKWQCCVSGASKIRLQDGEENKPREVPPSLSEAIGVLWNQLAPFNGEVLSHQCARRWKREKGEWGSDFPENWDQFFAEAREPSSHEQLEAMLRWREWEAEHDE
ncbi:hypothetical protein IAD21_04649 [Abditibacteriota bacterium]|nr:hypothetical protein IAD21_04649 [Abditibacteriota bacterium]